MSSASAVKTVPIATLITDACAKLLRNRKACRACRWRGAHRVAVVRAPLEHAHDRDDHQSDADPRLQVGTILLTRWGFAADMSSCTQPRVSASATSRISLTTRRSPPPAYVGATDPALTADRRAAGVSTCARYLRRRGRHVAARRSDELALVSVTYLAPCRPALHGELELHRVNPTHNRSTDTGGRLT